LEHDFGQVLDGLGPAGHTPEVVDVHWMLEELRIVQFAGGQGAKGVRDPGRPDQPLKPVSSKRIRKALDESPVPA
jgi:ATP-dependent helicase HrpA